MSRRLRSYLPGVAFHITARTQGREPLFVGREQRIVEMIHASTARSDLRLLAFVVMPNHLHLVVIQGEQPLADYMQPLLCRVALLVQRMTEREGHVFERRFRESPCFDAEYFRNSIAYVHLNPVRAGLTHDVRRYQWSSHALYCDPAESAGGSAISVHDGLRMFAAESADELDICSVHYSRFIAWRIAEDRYRCAEGIGVPLPPLRPSCRAGDACWEAEHPAPPSPGSYVPPRRAQRADLRDVALRVLAGSAPDMPLELLRSGDRGREIVRVRRDVMVRALLLGYSPKHIARFFCVSVSAVSYVRMSMRMGYRQ